MKEPIVVRIGCRWLDAPYAAVVGNPVSQMFLPKKKKIYAGAPYNSRRCVNRPWQCVDRNDMGWLVIPWAIFAPVRSWHLVPGVVECAVWGEHLHDGKWQKPVEGTSMVDEYRLRRQKKGNRKSQWSAKKIPVRSNNNNKIGFFWRSKKGSQCSGLKRSTSTRTSIEANDWNELQDKEGRVSRMTMTLMATEDEWSQLSSNKN